MASVTRSPSGSRAERRQKVLDRLLVTVEGALESGVSFTELSVERITTEAGISRSTFYLHFEDKGDLLVALSEDVAMRQMEAASRWWRLEPPPTRDTMLESIGEVFQARSAHEPLWTALTDVAAYDKRVADRFREIIGGGVAALATHLAEGIEHGVVSSDVDPERSAAWVVWMMESGLRYLVKGANQKEVDRLVDALAILIWRALYLGASQ